MLSTWCIQGDRSMVTLTQTIKGSVNSGRHISTIQLRLVKSHYVWRSSRCLGLLSLQATVTRSSMHLLTFRYTRQSLTIGGRGDVGITKTVKVAITNLHHSRAVVDVRSVQQGTQSARQGRAEATDEER